MLAVDVETHDWLDRSTPFHVGQYGHLSFVSAENLNYSRIVQFGWVIFRITNKGMLQVEKKVQECVSDLPVRMSSKAKRFHGLTDEQLRRGQPLATILSRFGRACDTVQRSGGRLMAHHLEFDAGLICAG